jgi:hypothetical protein
MSFSQVRSAASSVSLALSGDEPHSQTVAPSVPELLPWADPYIADLHRQHARDLRRERVVSEPIRFNCRIRERRSPHRFERESRQPERTIRLRTPSALAW